MFDFFTITDISEFHFRDVIQLLGPDDLRKLFQALGVDYSDVEKVERNVDTTDIDTKAWNVLRLWRNRLGAGATRSCILNALEKCMNMEACEQLDETWNQRGNIKLITT